MTDRAPSSRPSRGVEANREIAAVFREFRRAGCHATQHAMALSILDLRRALRELQTVVLERSDVGPGRG